jgi:hypothetical protein
MKIQEKHALIHAGILVAVAILAYHFTIGRGSM